jgi:hypothetical protein
MLIGAAVSVITILLLLLAALDNPFQSGVGGLEPVAMERSLGMIDDALSVTGREVPIPCDEAGARIAR